MLVNCVIKLSVMRNVFSCNRVSSTAHSYILYISKWLGLNILYTPGYEGTHTELFESVVRVAQDGFVCKNLERFDS